MNEKGIEKPPDFSISANESMWISWLGRLRNAFPKHQTFDVSINPASVAANSESVQTFAVAGLKTSDIVTVNKPSNSAGLDIVQCWVSATDALSIKFRNHTGSAIDAGAETYLISAIRR